MSLLGRLWMRAELTATVRFSKLVVLTHVHTEERDSLLSLSSCLT